MIYLTLDVLVPLREGKLAHNGHTECSLEVHQTFVSVLVTLTYETWIYLLGILLYEDGKKYYLLNELVKQKNVLCEKEEEKEVEKENNDKKEEKEVEKEKENNNNNDSEKEKEKENVLQSLSREAIASGKLVLCEEGVGGTYFLYDNDNKKFGVFKPTDEEPGAVNNPKDLLDDPILPPGGGASREVAAYLLDRSMAGVPETYFLENVSSMKFCTSNGNDVKSGSVQKYIHADGSSSSFGSSSFLVEDVHKIGILDIRILNLDRNDENILVQQVGNTKRLIPIDHTYSLPPSIQTPYFEWMYWKQAKLPFSDNLKDEIKKIDIEEDANLLRSIGISEDSIMTMKITTTLLKKCVAKGMNLFQIANIMCPEPRREMSKLEEKVSKVNKQLESEEIVENDLFMVLFEKEIDEFLMN